MQIELDEKRQLKFNSCFCEIRSGRLNQLQTDANHPYRRQSEKQRHRQRQSAHLETILRPQKIQNADIRTLHPDG